MVLWIILLCIILKNLNVFDIRVKLISCQHLTILLGYTVKGYVIKTVGVYIIKTFGILFALFC